MDDDANFESDMQRFAKFFIKHDPNPSRYPKPEGAKNQHVYYPFDFKKKRGNLINLNNNDRKPSLYNKPKMPKTFIKGFNVWLLKPTGLNRGRGIEVFNKLEKLNGFINEFFEGFVELGPNQRRSKKNDHESVESQESDEEDKKKPRGEKLYSVVFYDYQV